MPYKSYSEIDVTDYLKNKYPDTYNNNFQQVILMQSEDKLWYKILQTKATPYGLKTTVYENDIITNTDENGNDILSAPIETNASVFCDNKTLLYYHTGILTDIDEIHDMHDYSDDNEEYYADHYDEDEDEDEEYCEATIEEMREEALLRLKLFDQMLPCVINDFQEDGTLYMSEGQGCLYYLEEREKELVSRLEADGSRIVFHVLHYNTAYGEMLAMLYVCKDKSEWKNCREELKHTGKSYCYGCNLTDPHLSEHGSIAVKQLFGGLIVNQGLFGSAL